MKSDKIINNCSICGQIKELTFEHFPPGASGNQLPVFMMDHRHLTPFDENLYGKKVKSNKGLGANKTCKECNNNTGGYYANEYVKFVKSFINCEGKLNESHNLMQFELCVFPLRLLKQIIIHHLCADQALGQIRSLVNQTNFILDPEAKSLSNQIKLFLYATFSNTHRFQGISICWDTNLVTPRCYSEFNFHPFGTLLSII